MAKDANGNKVKSPKADKAAKPAAGNSHGLGAPGTGGQFSAEAELGRLILITPTEIEKDIVTSNGTADATRASLVILDGKGSPKVIDDALIFQKVVQGQLREAITNRSRVVGRLFLDQSAKKAGQNAPYKLAAPTEADIALATGYLDSLDPLR